MQLRISSLCTILCLLFLGIFDLSAQIYQVNSPYSRVGIGSIAPSSFAANRAMGGISAAFRSPLNINYNNPASYSALQLTTLETAITGNGLWLASDDLLNPQGTGSVSIAHLSFGFPVAKFWGTSIGLLPYSGLNYNIQITENNDLGRTEQNFIGNGQLYQFYWGNGFEYKGFSAGFNVAWVFGTYQQQSRLVFPILTDSDVFANQGFTLGSQQTDESVVGDFIWNAGLQYELKLPDKYSLIAGVYGNTATELNLIRNFRWEKVGTSAGIITVLDTIKNVPDEKNSFRLPSNYAVGVALQKGANWMMALDLSFHNWTEFEKYGETDALLTNSTRIAFGAAVTPETSPFGKLWRRTQYRFGAHYNTGNIFVNEQRLPDFGLSFGIGLPFRRSFSRVNATIEVGQRGNLANNLIRETYLLGTFGVTLTDRWFVKRRYE